MLKQTEGSRAVAEAVALCRPDVICAYPISPQTHIVEGLGEMVKSGALVALRVHQRRERVRRDERGDRLLGGRRADLHRHGSQGLLFMAEAVYNASGLGLPIVMTIANRAIGAPINIWNDHSDCDGHARQRLDPALRRDQPGGARPAHPGLQAGRGTVDAGDGVHGRLHPDPRLRARRHSRAGRGRRLPAAVRAAPGARSGRSGLDRRDGRAGGLHGGALPRARQADFGARAHPAHRRRVRGRASGASRAASCAATGARTPRRSSSRSAR